MANKILNLKLSYRGKQLDTIKQGSDFVKKWYIGRDKRIFWHVLDDSNTFPPKHQLLVKRGSDYYLQLPAGSSISCSKDNNPVDAAFLQQNGILQGTQLKLRNDMGGTVQLHPDYAVEFGYTDQVLPVLGLKEQAIVADCAQAPSLSTVERTNRGLILLFLILGLAFILIYDIVLKPQSTAERSLSEMLAQMERAHRIVPQFGEQSQDVVEPFQNDVQEPQTYTTGQAARRTTAEPSRPRSAQAVFGDLATPGTAGRDRGAYQATVLNEFVTARPGSRGGGTGPVFPLADRVVNTHPAPEPVMPGPLTPPRQRVIHKRSLARWSPAEHPPAGPPSGQTYRWNHSPATRPNCASSLRKTCPLPRRPR
ncbi:MAG: hypothetical protein K0B87_02320 [Candidatus Syntrophosphaera sp.]|nr:hypothetical protein [Candidatus Syntrophosphaera sp.]